MKKIPMVAFGVAAFCGCYAVADDAMQATVSACIDTQFSQNQSAKACLDVAHARCDGEPENAATVAAECYQKTNEFWTKSIRLEMQSLAEKAPQDIAVITGIELKYDILTAMLQCDRQEALALAAGTIGADVILRQKLRCQSSVTGLAFTRLKWQTRDVQ